MRNLKLVLNYDGTYFSGWQWQPQNRTVQGELRQSILHILHEEVNIIGAGRTDAGVHAAGQVANFLTNAEMSTSKLKAALNGTLAKDIRVQSVDEVDEGFNSRFDAINREYHYTISRQEKAIARQYVYCYRYELDMNKIREASEYCLGENDFASFCQSHSDVTHHRCHVERLEWIENVETIQMRIIANRFLHNMVRIIVGTMIQVGLGKIEPAAVGDILKARDRRRAGPTVPARGLCLAKVYYSTESF